MRALKTTTQLELAVRSNSVSASWGMFTFISLVQWMRSGNGRERGGGVNRTTKQSENRATDRGTDRQRHRQTEAVINLRPLQTSPETSQVQVSFERRSWRQIQRFGTGMPSS